MSGVVSLVVSLPDHRRTVLLLLAAATLAVCLRPDLRWARRGRGDCGFHEAVLTLSDCADRFKSSVEVAAPVRVAGAVCLLIPAALPGVLKRRRIGFVPVRVRRLKVPSAHDRSPSSRP